MFGKRGAVVFVVAIALAAGACGGTDWNAARKPKAPTAAQVRAAAAARQKAEQPYVIALAANLQANDSDSSPIPTADAQCYATAIVHGMGVRAFVVHKLTPNVLSNPRTTLEALPNPTAAQVNVVGGALQRCPLLRFGADFSRGLGVTDAATVACVTRGIGGPVARRFLVMSFLGRSKMDLPTAQGVVDLMARCTDIATLVVGRVDRITDPATRQCVINALHGVDAAMKQYMALAISGADPEQLQEAQGEVAVAINQCRPGAETGFTVPAN